MTLIDNKANSTSKQRTRDQHRPITSTDILTVTNNSKASDRLDSQSNLNYISLHWVAHNLPP